MAAPKRRATYQDLKEVPDVLVAELIDGELFTSPRPAAPHALTTARLVSDLGPPFDLPPGDPDGPGGWCILVEPELHFGQDVLVPDLAAWRRSRMPAVPNVVAFTLAPDWVCEVISPSTGRLDRARKMQVYAREGIPHLWIIDPILRTLETYRLEGGHWVVAGAHGGMDVVRVEPFEAIELRCQRWWLEA